MTITVVKAVVEDLASESCCTCGIRYAVPVDWLREKKRTGGGFFCPNGHSLTYAENEFTRMQRELAQVRSRLDQTEAEKAKIEKDLKKAKKMVACGQCPVCDRSFRSLRTHMTNKHPEYVAEAVK